MLDFVIPKHGADGVPYLDGLTLQRAMLDFVIPKHGTDAVPYLDGLTLQRAVHRAVVAGTAPDTVILLEHEPVYTAGRGTAADERPVDRTPVIDVDRGGKLTWHGPGQLVGYPILRLGDPVDVVGYVRRLENVLIGVLAGFGIDGRRVGGRSGVWVGEARDDKIAAIGIRVAGGVTMHGFALNCSNALEPYDRIVPCGIRDAGVTTMSHVLGRRVTPDDVRPRLQRGLSAEFAGVAA